MLVFPYPERYGGSMANDAVESNEKKDNMMSFGFNVSQKDAEKQLQQEDEEENALNDFIGGGFSGSQPKESSQEYQPPQMENFNATGPTLAPQNMVFGSNSGGNMMY